MPLLFDLSLIYNKGEVMKMLSPYPPNGLVGLVGGASLGEEREFGGHPMVSLVVVRVPGRRHVAPCHWSACVSCANLL